MKNIINVLFAALLILVSFIAPLSALEADAPVLSEGYLNAYWTFATFEAAPALFNLTLNDLKPADRTPAVVGNTLNGATPASKVTVTGKSMAMLNHISGFKLESATPVTTPFPSIWLKGTYANPSAGTGASDDPRVFLTGTDTDKFYQTGLTIMAPYYDVPDYQWTVYLYADKDIITQTAGPATGKVMDPRQSTMRWFAWTSDSAGIPQYMWTTKPVGGTTAYFFNTVPIIANSATAATKKAFLTGTTGSSLPELPAGFTAITGVSKTAVPADGEIHYVNERNTANPNGFTISGRSQAGLIYASPSNALSHRTEMLHVQFMVHLPVNATVSPATKTCVLNVYQRTAY